MAKKQSWKRWLSVTLAAIFVLPAILSLFGVITLRVVLTDSMSPQIQPKDLVVTANWIKPLPGEVAIYHERDVEGKLMQDVVHRVVTLNANGEYQFKGDNNKSVDALAVPKSDVVGTVFLKVRGVGYFLTPAALLVIAMITGGVVALVYGIRSLRR